jgi:hypothetical protein
VQKGGFGVGNHLLPISSPIKASHLKPLGVKDHKEGIDRIKPPARRKYLLCRQMYPSSSSSRKH